MQLKSLYLHYPFCRHLCNYCDFYKNVPKHSEENLKFQEQLSKMFIHHEEQIKKLGYSWGELETFYIGGGTPSLWGEEGVKFLSELFSENNINLSQDCEFTLEVNPGSWSEQGLQAWKDFGVNRFSLGIQSLDSRFIKILDRVHNIDDVYTTLSKFNEIDANFSVDFMLGLPFSVEYERDIIKELDIILKYNPSHISLYILTVKEHYVHFTKLPDDEFIEKEYITVSKYLKEKGFEHYEVSNFALKDKSSKHNMKYWKMGTVAALGPSATGFLSEEKLRYKWKVSSIEYIPELLNEKEVFLEELYMNLRVSDGLGLDYFEGTINSESLKQIANTWVARGLGEISSNKIKLNSQGFLILDFLMDEIFQKISF